MAVAVINVDKASPSALLAPPATKVCPNHSLMPMAPIGGTIQNMATSIILRNILFRLFIHQNYSHGFENAHFGGNQPPPPLPPRKRPQKSILTLEAWIILAFCSVTSLNCVPYLFFGLLTWYQLEILIQF